MSYHSERSTAALITAILAFIVALIDLFLILARY